MSDIAETNVAQGGSAARLGADLRAARERQGWDLHELAQSLRIRQSYLEAIEGGRVAELPGPTYAMGFVRTYAAALGMQAEEVAKRFRAEAEGITRQPALSFPAPVPQRGVPAGALMLLGLVILACAYGGWYWISEHRATPVETVGPLPDRLAQMAPNKTPPPPSPQVASVVPAGGAPPPQKIAPSLPQTAAPPPAPATVPPTPSPPVAPVPALAPTLAPNVTVAAPPAAPPASRIVIKATADAWATVKQPAGPALLNKLLHAGDTWPVPGDKSGLMLTTGNAGGTEIDVDGAPITASLGRSGAVRRDVPLDADALKSGSISPVLRKPIQTAPVPASPAPRADFRLQ